MLLAAALVLMPTHAWAATNAQDATELRYAIDPLDVSGRDFAGLRLPIAATAGNIRFRAVRAATWLEEPFIGPDGTPNEPVRRLYLEQEVSIELGLYSFEAERATVWMQADPNQPNEYQVFVVLDQVGSLTGDASVSVTADRLPVEGILRTNAPIILQADVRDAGRPSVPFIGQSERVLADRLRSILGYDTRPTPITPLLSRTDDSAIGSDGGDRSEFLRTLPQIESPRPIFADSGVISVAAGDIALVRGEAENSLLATDDVVIQYWDRETRQTLQISAARGVVFMKPGELRSLASMQSEDVLGFYLEGNVIASDGEYTLRGPRVYYDVQSNRAIVIDAVFWTYDERRSMPLYLRAETIRQESEQEFSAEQSTLANTRFFTPHFAVGGESITVTRYTRNDGNEGNRIDAKNLTIRGGGVPFFYWPFFRGDPERIPLRNVGFENANGSGEAFKTTWNLLALLGVEDALDPLEADLAIDYFLERGLALGLESTWQRDDYEGGLFAYMLLDDTGTDDFRSGAERDRDGGTRGIILGEHRAQVTDRLTVFLEGSYIGDEAFVDAFFENLAEERREFTNRAYARWLDQNQAFTAEVKGEFNDFISNDYLLQSQGYAVDRLPELAYYRIGDDILSDIAPGMLTYNSETRASHLQMNFAESTPSQIGLVNPTISGTVLGIGPDTKISDALRAGGLEEDSVFRIDSRHELTAALELGAINVTPFAVGRITAYDSDFPAFSPAETDNVRLWGQAGVSLETSITKVDDSVESRFFDLHRIRHIIEPGFTVAHSGSTVDRVDLPVYDESIESITEGTYVRFGLDQTWQTKRGGPGRWRSVDFLKIDNEFVITSDDADRESPIGRYFGYRPELSNPGDFWRGAVAWQTTDALATSAEMVYDFELSQPARTSVGMRLSQGRVFSAYTETRFLNAENSTFIDFGGTIQLTEKYLVGTNLTYNTNADDFQNIGFTVRREFPNVILGVAVNFDRITDETSFGFVLVPTGFDEGSLRLFGLGSREARNSVGSR